jgi:predicted transcriptional regulator of viral defense system
MADAIDKVIAALAAKQWGYIAHEQLLAIGLGRRAIQSRVATGRLTRVHRGVYAVGHVPVGPVPRAAAVLACGEKDVLSHGSALTLWGVNKYWDLPFEVTVRSSHRRRPGIKVHRSRTLTDKDIDRQLGVPVTSPARTALDNAPRLSDKRLTRMVNDLRHARYLNLDDLADVLTRNPSRLVTSPFASPTSD